MEIQYLQTFDHEDVTEQVDHHTRWLYGEKEKEPLDYSVLSVGVVTLGLILFVEVLRHQLDHQAERRPFFKSVLETTYSELATLGLVELFVFMVLRYYELKNKERKEVFAEVHFALFYTAIFNAFQSVLCAFFTRSASNKLWVQTEHLELDHYVEIREEFDRVSEEYLHGRKHHWFLSFLSNLRNPGLGSRYSELLVQVRFHQLRLNFLEGKKLPLTLKVSDYLKRAEQKVLIDMVHVDGMAWVFLTGGFILIYFLEGMLAYKTGDEDIVGTTLAAIFFSVLVIFIIICALVLFKMRSIFRDILEMEFKADTDEERAHAAEQQRNLFWFREPQFVISLIQFMQFGYAIQLAIVIMFWEDLGDIPSLYYFLAVLFCYAIFVSVLTKVLPQYTLCTSLGYLVDTKHLQESVAMHRLQEAQRRQKRKMIQMTFDSNALFYCCDAEDESAETYEDVTEHSNLSASDSNASQIKPGSPYRYSHILGRDNDAASKKDSSTILAELVKMDTAELRSQLPEHTKDRLQKRERRNERRNRQRAASQGVAAMRTMNTAITNVFKTSSESVLSSTREIAPTRSMDDAEPANDDRATRFANRAAKRKSVSASAVIQSWQDYSVAESNTIRNDAALSRRENDMHDEDFISTSHSVSTIDLDNVSKEFSAPIKVMRHSRRAQESKIVDLPDANLMSDLEAPNRSVDFPSSTSPVTQYHRIVEKSDEDDSTVDTGKSVGELSDVVDAAEPIFGSHRSLYHCEHKWDDRIKKSLTSSSLQCSLRSYFLSEKYHIVSHVFGTLIVFFLIGMRVETMNAVTGIYEGSDNTWQLKLNASFWWEAVWYMLFIVVDFLGIWAMQASRRITRNEQVVVVSDAMDLFLSVLCLTILFVAESQRCCEDEGMYVFGDFRRILHRFLGDDVDSYAKDAAVERAFDDDIFYQCCPFWGYRSFGGLGVIEPFTSLIALRVFRFWIAGILVARYFSDEREKKESGSSFGTDEDQASVDPDEHGKHKHGHRHGHGHGSMYDEKGTALELWERAISRYPDIVEKYGQFSGELFQAMLGLEILEEAAVVPKSVVSSSETSTEGERRAHVGKSKNHASNQPHYKLGDDRYSSLSAECQGIILAGKLGKPVKLAHGSSSASGKDLEFEVDEEVLEEEEKADTTLIAPNAKLVRSMRRCHRRLDPLLQEWIAVDAVITDYEVVYFDVEDEDEDDDDDDVGAGIRERRDAVLEALRATKGGQGLRLADVAAGRKIVGHLELSDVTHIHVERDMPVHDVSILEEIEDPFEVEMEKASEYWLCANHSEEHDHTRALRWAKVKEDRLKLVSMHGTLLLRFYSDLNDVEAHAEASQEEDEVFGVLKKNIAFQWAQTVSHTSGLDKLEQVFPHFGHNDSDELRDFLEVVHHVEEARAHRWRHSSAFDPGNSNEESGGRRLNRSMSFVVESSRSVRRLSAARPRRTSLFVGSPQLNERRMGDGSFGANSMRGSRRNSFFSAVHTTVEELGTEADDSTRFAPGRRSSMTGFRRSSTTSFRRSSATGPRHSSLRFSGSFRKTPVAGIEVPIESRRESLRSSLISALHTTVEEPGAEADGSDSGSEGEV